MEKGLNLRFQDREEFVSASDFNNLMHILLDKLLLGINENEPEYDRYGIYVQFGCCYYDATDEDDVFPVVHIDKWNNKTKRMDSLVLNGYPECFDVMECDLEFLSNFFNGDCWLFDVECNFDLRETGWDSETESYDYVDFLNRRLKHIRLINADDKITINVNGKETNCIDITDFFDDKIKEDLCSYIFEEVEDSLEEYIRGEID